MLCRALLIATVLTYLVCVLLLSGVQKEDLDVGTLRKLARHNVSIENIDARLKNDCFINVNVISTTFAEPESETTTLITIKDSNESTMEKENKYEADKIIQDNLVKSLMDFIKMKQGDNYFNTYDISMQYKKTTTEKEITEMTTPSTISEGSLEPSPKNFMEFWQMYVKNNSRMKDKVSETPSSTVGTTTNNYLKDIRDKYDGNNMTVPLISNNHIIYAPVEEIKKIFADFYKNVQPSSKEFLTSRQTGMSGAKEVKSIGLQTKNDVVYTNKTEKSLQYNNNLTQEKVYNFFNKKSESLDDFYTKLQRGRHTNSYDFVATTTLKNKLSNPTTTNHYDEIQVTEPTKPENLMNSNTLNEIAKSIKTSILQDLRKEILQSSTDKGTTAGIERSTENSTNYPKQTTAKYENAEETQVIDRIALMLEQLKSMKSKLPEVKIETKPISPPKPTNNEELKLPYLGPAEIAKGKKMQESNVEYLPQRIKTLNIFTLNQEPVIEFKGFKKIPITIQTNSGVVPPLAISVQKPPLLMQNILVTTEFPYMKARNNRQRIHQSFLKRKKDVKERKTFPTTVNTLFEDYGNEGVDLSKYGSNANKKTKPVKDRDWWVGPKANKVKDKLRYQMFESQHNRNLHGRFHERLEQSNVPSIEFPMGTIWHDENNSKVAPRQQLSLNNILKGVRYDDTHFKNFIKTQEKVNDILEKILASRKIATDPHSSQA